MYVSFVLQKGWIDYESEVSDSGGEVQAFREQTAAKGRPNLNRRTWRPAAAEVPPNDSATAEVTPNHSATTEVPPNDSAAAEVPPNQSADSTSEVPPNVIAADSASEVPPNVIAAASEVPPNQSADSPPEVPPNVIAADSEVPPNVIAADSAPEVPPNVIAADSEVQPNVIADVPLQVPPNSNVSVAINVIPVNSALDQSPQGGATVWRHLNVPSQDSNTGYPSTGMSSGSRMSRSLESTPMLNLNHEVRSTNYVIHYKHISKF